MRHYDALDWTHSWDHFEMSMYLRFDEAKESGIYMQIAERFEIDGAEEWTILYDRCLQPYHFTPEQIAAENEDWQDEILRNYLDEHPQLVNEEKERVARFLADHIER